MLWINVLAITEVEIGLLVEHNLIGGEEVVVKLVEILGITGQLIHLGHHWHHHVEGIAPPPVVCWLRVGLVVHHFLGTLHHVF